MDRLRHIIAVAEKMRRLSAEKPEQYPVDPDDMYVLGMLHDIGYRFCDVQKEHARRGGELLEKQGYKYWREVYYHGTPQQVYDSPELRLLNYADMTTGPSGEDMNVRQRIEDIAVRYGADSLQKKEAEELARIFDME